MNKLKIFRGEELTAELRNKLSLPLTVLNNFMLDKKVSKQSIKAAIVDLEEILKWMEKRRNRPGKKIA